MNLSDFKKNILYSNHEYEEGDSDKYKIRITNIIALTGMIGLLIFIPTDLVNMDYPSAVMEIIVAFVITAIFITLRLNKKSINLIGYILIFLVIAGNIVYFLTAKNIGIYRLTGIFILPLMAFFLKGKKKGMLISGLFISILAVLTLIDHLEIVDLKLDYNYNSLLLIFVDYMFNLFFVYSYQDVIDLNGKVIVEKNTKLEDSLNTVSKEASERKKAEENLSNQAVLLKEQAESLSKKNEELSQLNKFMLDREIKMVELKKEVESLRAQLAQKAS